VKPTIFTYNELRTATRDFHPDMKLGQGSYGAVYKVELLTLFYELCHQSFEVCWL